MSESSVQSLEKDLGPRLIRTQGLTSLDTTRGQAQFNVSKGDDACLFLKIDRNPNITVPTRKGRLVSLFTSRSVRIVLPSLV